MRNRFVILIVALVVVVVFSLVIAAQNRGAQGGQHADAQTDEIQNRTPQRIRERIRDKEEEHHVAVVLRRESSLAKNRG